jgi:hypothetical protein
MHRRGGRARRREQDGGLVNLKAFFVETLSSALDLGIAIPDDVIRHVTPDVLAQHLPRPLWARLLTACVGAAHVDAQLVVETIGVPNLCEHVPAQIIWGCIEEIALRTLGGVVIATPVATPLSRTFAAPANPVTRPIPLATPPPPPANEPRTPAAPAAVGPSIPTPGTEPESEAVTRGRIPAAQRFRQSNTGIGRLASSSSGRRPQAQATPPAPPPASDAASERSSSSTIPRVKRGQTDGDFDLETYVGNKDDWKNALAVEDEQLVDWSASDETVNNVDDAGRKR